MRTCTNGQPRYNKWCEFNQSFHLTRDGITPVRLKKVLYQWSELLNDNGVEFIKCDYKDIFEKVSNEDFLYLDPPYQNERSTKYFCNFNYEDFFDRVGILNDMGVKYILSSDGKYVPDYCYENIIYLKGGGGSYQKTVEHMSTGHMYETLYFEVKDEKYFQSEFVILFYNYGSLPSSMYPNDRSNVDNWNIDFVYLDKNRSYYDRTYPLVTFSEKSPSLLKRYQSMPYRQYVNNPTVAIATEYQMFISNLDSVVANTQYTCFVQNRASEWSFDYSSKWCNISPFTLDGFQNCDGDNSTQACPRLKNFLFDMDSSVDTASYLVTHIIKVDDEISTTKGDTMYGIQKFYNYYAYDDGIPERGYGVVPEDSYFASQFSVSVPDTLRGVYMLFNRTYQDANYDFFDIVVWNDNNGKPGNEVYRLKNQRPIWDDEEIFKFSYYTFDDIVRVNGVIYVGVMQHSEESINIGFDTSKDNSQYNFYNSGYGWENSSMKGSLMIRPVLGCDMLSLDEEDYVENKRLILYPNPSKNMLNISGVDSQFCDEIMIFDMTGRLMKQFTNNVNLDVSDLQNGLYMMRVVTDEGKSYTEKFMISR